MARKWGVFFRQVESVLKRGLRFFLLGMLGVIFALGIPVLEIAQSREVSQTISPQATPQQLMESGREFYRRDRYSEAAEALREAADIYAAQGNRLNQSLALSYLSLTYQKLAQWENAEKASKASLQLAGMGETSGDRIARAVALNSQGHLLLSVGDAETAFATWEKAAAEYQHLNDEEGQLGALVNQAQALEQLGYYRRSCNLLLEVVGAENNRSCDAIETKSDIELVQGYFAGETNPELKAIALRSLGNVLRAIGQLDASEQILQNTWVLISQIDSPREKSLTLFFLANTQQSLAKQKEDYGEIQEAEEYRKAAINYYHQALAIAPSSTIKLLGQLNLFSLLRQSETQGRELQSLLAAIQSQMSEMKLSKPLVEVRIKLACSLMQCEKLGQGETAELALVSREEIDGLLQQAITEAERLGDGRVKSYALGTRGKQYEYFWLTQGQKQGANPTWEKAQQLTQEALDLAVQSNAPELSYQWQWQRGRLLAGEGNLEGAIANYTAAVETLDKVREDLLAIDSEVQFSFRDRIEPVYRQFVDLLLQPSEQNSERIDIARKMIDELQLAEIENFLQCNLSKSLPTTPDLERIFTNTALIYPIILDNRIEVIVKLPNRKFKHYDTWIEREISEGIIENFRSSIVNVNQEKLVENSHQIYQWIIEPIENDLEQRSDIDTLVFVLDGKFRNIPMAALQDAKTQEYLIQKKYAIALLPNSQLFELDASANKLNVLAVGVSDPLSVGEQIFPQIEADKELNSIQTLIPTTQVLLNSQFTPTTLEQRFNIGDFSVLHMATHGQFSSNPEQTYVLAYGSENLRGKLLKSKELDNLLRSGQQQVGATLDLLVLSACKTAEGDTRATLGLAGLAIRAGTRSTLASLWKVKDDMTLQLIEQFYNELKKDGVTKAQALHHAQKALLIQDTGYETYLRNPAEWAPYVLVGNWR